MVRECPARSMLNTSFVDFEKGFGTFYLLQKNKCLFPTQLSIYFQKNVDWLTHPYPSFVYSLYILFIYYYPRPEYDRNTVRFKLNNNQSNHIRLSSYLDL